MESGLLATATLRTARSDQAHDVGVGAQRGQLKGGAACRVQVEAQSVARGGRAPESK